MNKNQKILLEPQKYILKLQVCVFIIYFVVLNIVPNISKVSTF